MAKLHAIVAAIRGENQACGSQRLQVADGGLDMRRILVVLGFSALALAAGSSTGRAEITYPWCAQYGGGGNGGGRNCGFWTYQQCQIALSGNGGYCQTNAMYRGPQPGMIPPPGSAVLPPHR
jgi:hypothetical protein